MARGDGDGDGDGDGMEPCAAHGGGAGREEPSDRQQKYEEELEKIRTEGDLALIKAHAERQRITKADEELQLLKAQLKHKKKQFIATHKTALVLHRASGANSNAETPAAAASGGAGLSPVSTGSALDGNVGESHVSIGMPMNADRLIQVEERLKTAMSERAVELAKLRHQIDETRCRRLEGLQSEKRMVDETKRVEDEIQQAQSEVNALKERGTALKSEVVQLQSDLDVDKQAFRIERQRLTLEVDRIAKPEKGGVRVNLPTRKSVYNNIGHRSKHGHLSRAKKMSLEQKVMSFEQKKLLLDKLVEETGVQNFSEFIEQYNEQERIKADILARIETKSNMNTSLIEQIAQLAEDITRLSGAGDIQSIVHMEQPSELKRLIEADDSLISQWTRESQVYAETLKTFRDPIRDLYLELFPQDRDDEVSDSTINETSMLRRIGAIEERTMQRVLTKIHHEMETQQFSDTWMRLRKYQGLQWKENDADHSDSSNNNAEYSSTSRSKELHVTPPSIWDATLQEQDDDDAADQQMDDVLAVVHPDEFRHKQNNINKVSTTQNGAATSSGGSNSNSSSSAAATQAQRKHAAITL
uniref:Uncharacterized protein n=1 Tax=Globisporangium ultimum (strain ATCC 200006 / CBS 805.95 / DAOM BR144) TaxID=431595 RepID=K3WUS1_GLOUD